MTRRPLYITCNGEPVREPQATVHVQNPAVTSALGVYETVEIANGRLFHLEDHLERLARSAATIDLPLPASPSRLARWAHATVEAARQRDGLLRVLALAGDADDPPRVYMLVLPPIRYPASLYRQGATAITFVGERALPTAKTLNTLVNFLAQRAARARGCHEALLVTRAGILEGSSSNIFVVMHGKLITPPDHLVLAGVTRDIVLRLARERGYAIVFRPLSPATIPQWEEAFITSTSRHVMPLTVVDDRPIGQGTVGPITQALRQAFEAYFAAQVGLDPDDHPLEVSRGPAHRRQSSGNTP